MLFYLMLENIKIMNWIEVKIKPEIGTEILFTDGCEVYFGSYGYLSEYDKERGLGFIDATTWSSDFGYEHFENNITHWMELPEPPKQ